MFQIRSFLSILYLPVWYCICRYYTDFIRGIQAAAVLTRFFFQISFEPDIGYEKIYDVDTQKKYGAFQEKFSAVCGHAGCQDKPFAHKQYHFAADNQGEYRRAQVIGGQLFQQSGRFLRGWPMLWRWCCRSRCTDFHKNVRKYLSHHCLTERPARGTEKVSIISTIWNVKCNHWH